MRGLLSGIRSRVNRLALKLVPPHAAGCASCRGQARSHPTPSRSDDVGERFYRARDAFSAPRFEALYCAWKQDGESVLSSAGSRAISIAVDVGAGRVETLELGHRYGHLSPLVAVA